MRQLFDRFGDKDDHKDDVITKSKKKRTTRKSSERRNTSPQKRTISRSFIVDQKHNKIQIALKKRLTEQYGNENVILEENHVDIKLLQPAYISFYEVKSASYAAECVKEALGQILLYSLNDSDKRPEKHIVVGQYPATENDSRGCRHYWSGTELHSQISDRGTGNDEGLQPIVRS